MRSARTYFPNPRNTIPWPDMRRSIARREPRTRLSSCPQARDYRCPTHIHPREAELVAEAIESNWIAPLGPHVDAFEAEVAAVAGVQNAVELSSGTAALHRAP